MSEIAVSAKTIGAISMPEFCERCYWIKLHCRLPYQMFPGIFSSIDSYTKKVIHSHIDKHGAVPGWLAPLGDITGYVDPPNWRKYQAVDEVSGVRLRGEADAIFRLSNGHYMIGDYKTSRFKGKGDAFYPIYEAQLNAYAFIGERMGYAPIDKLALIYFQPNTEDETAAREGVTVPEGFLMEFNPHILEVDLDPENIVRPLLQRTREIYEMEEMPDSREGCRDCEKLLTLVGSVP